jgi:hypothetical protein
VSANASIPVYELTQLDKARFRRAAARYSPMMSVAAAYWLLMLNAYRVRDGEMALLKPTGARPSLEQFASFVGHLF